MNATARPGITRQRAAQWLASNAATNATAACYLGLLNRHGLTNTQWLLVVDMVRLADANFTPAAAGSASGPCLVHSNPQHATCRVHRCCIGKPASECRAARQPVRCAHGHAEGGCQFCTWTRTP